MWYKDGYYWRKKNSDGSDGKGDLIFNTCYKILQDEDESDWAYNALDACAILLLTGKRWPGRMWSPLDAESMVERIITLSLRKVGIILKRYEFRYQRRMTRDPFIAFYTLALFLGDDGYIKEVPMPWYLYSPNTWRWRRRLISDDRADYVIRLGYVRAMATILKYEN